MSPLFTLIGVKPILNCVLLYYLSINNQYIYPEQNGLSFTNWKARQRETKVMQTNKHTKTLKAVLFL